MIMEKSSIKNDVKNNTDKQVVISCGPIPARLDSVKFITNRFKGGLAFKTAECLIDDGYNVTVVKWVGTSLPAVNGLKADYWLQDNVNIVSVSDVVEYYNWFEENASKYDAFIMAAAVANLMPSNPYTGKFPSHNYKVGDKFDIKFEIAPRAIDIIKVKNPRAALIGYKLFDAHDDTELIDIARHTLKDSKANVIFANTPSTAKEKKIAVLQDNTAVTMSFDEHIRFIKRIINAKYFKTKIVGSRFNEGESKQIKIAKAFVKYFEQTFDKFGTVGVKIRLSNGYMGMVTTSRGHQGEPVYVKGVDINNGLIYADAKATLNAALLWTMLKNNENSSYVVHRHENDPRYNGSGLELLDYKLAGTMEEIDAAKSINYKDFNIAGHGNIKCYSMQSVRWDKYYNQFPSKYFSTPDIMEFVLKMHGYDTKGIIEDALEVGGNTRNICKYKLDPAFDDVTHISYSDLKYNHFEYGLVLLRNSINYLSDDELMLVKNAVSKNGMLIANGFREAPDLKITENEVAVKVEDKINHTLFIEDQAIRHEFYSRGEAEYLKLGFEVVRYSESSILIVYRR